MPDIKLICLDVDGTLVADDHTSIPDLNKKALAEAMRRGIHIALVSGRLSTSLHPIQKKAGITGPLGCFSGALVVDEYDKILDSHPITEEQALKVIDLARSCDVTTFLFGQRHWYKERQDYFATLEEEIASAGIMTEDFDSLIKTGNQPWYKVLCMSTEEQVISSTKARFQEVFGDELNIYLSSPRYLELSVKGIDKGNAVDVLLSHYKLQRSQCMAIGDFYNDIGMFHGAGLSVAMGNAPEAVKREADIVTATNVEGGLGKAIMSIL